MKLDKRFLFLLVSTPMLVLVVGILCLVVYWKAKTLSDDVDRHIEIQSYLQELLTELLNAETGQRGYLLTNRENFLEPYYKAIRTLKIADKDFERTDVRVALSNEQFRRLARLTEERFIVIQRTIALHQSGDKEAAIELVKSEKGKILMDSIRGIVEPAITDLDKKLRMDEAQLARYTTAIAILIGFALLFVCVMSLLFYQSIANEIANRDAMNKTLEERNKQLKAFTYQSYHQLKSPLRSIAGFLQLLQKRMGKQMDQESAEMIRFSVEACEKMNEQIDEIRSLYLNEHPEDGEKIREA